MVDKHERATWLYQYLVNVNLITKDGLDVAPMPEDFKEGWNDPDWYKALEDFVVKYKIKNRGSDKLLIEEDDYIHYGEEGYI